MTLEADIIERVQADFSDTEGQKALDELLASGKAGRIARCIVFAARGSLERLRDHIRMADADHRDVIVAGEYDIIMHQVRDLRVSFLIASPDDFWIGETAASIHKRGYYLTELKSQPATVGPFDYTCDRSEGLATFSKGEDTIMIQKHDRNWSLIQDDPDVRTYGLDVLIGDEERFRIQLDYYLSQR